MAGERGGRADWPTHQLAAAVGTAPSEHVLGTLAAEGALERAHDGVGRVGRQVAIAAFAVWTKRQPRARRAGARRRFGEPVDGVRSLDLSGTPVDTVGAL